VGSEMCIRDSFGGAATLASEGDRGDVRDLRARGGIMRSDDGLQLTIVLGLGRHRLLAFDSDSG